MTWVIDRSRPVGPQVYRYLRHSIIRNLMPPGTRISESEIAATCAVSRQPVREAFIKLAEEGLLEVRPQRGTYVCKISLAAVLDARFVREAIEADVVTLLAETADDAMVAELRAQVARQRAILPADRASFIDHDDRFHRTLAELAGKSYAWSVLESMKSQIDRVRYLSLRQFPIEPPIEQHHTVVEAIARRNPPEAERALREHLRKILLDLPTILAEKPDFFEDVAIPVNYAATL